MLRDLFFIIFGYLIGSVLFAKILGKIISGKDITENTKDTNPGTANAFIKGGFLCGILTLCCDLLKGFLPVFLYLQGEIDNSFALVMCAPVIGHIYPVYYCFRGGKGIATTFGCLLGLLPVSTPVLLLAVFFVLFSVVIRVSPHFYRTLVSYFFAEIFLFVFHVDFRFIIGFTIILVVTTLRMVTNKEEKEDFNIKFLWMR